VKQSLERVMTEPCPYCSGSGCDQVELDDLLRILSEVRKIGADLNGHRLLLRVNPDIARALKEEKARSVRDLKQTLGKDVTIKPDVQLHHEQFDVMAV
jgi:ribonuclease G